LVECRPYSRGAILLRAGRGGMRLGGQGLDVVRARAGARRRDRSGVRSDAVGGWRTAGWLIEARQVRNVMVDDGDRRGGLSLEARGQVALVGGGTSRRVAGYADRHPEVAGE